MANCTKCGAVLADNEKFCDACGAPVATVEDKVNAAAEKASAKFEEIANTPDTTAQYTAEDINNNKVMAVLAYFGPLVLVPIFGAKDSKFARFHANQGLVLFILDVAYGIIVSILNTIFYAISFGFGAIMSTILGLVWILIAILAIIGIVNASQGKAKELPIIGKIKILK